METTSSSVQGACHCGAVRYRLAGDPVSVVNCHCRLCRGLSGSAFTSYVVVRDSDLSLELSEGGLSSYQATEAATKHFCSHCGTPMFNTNPTKYPSLRMVYLGTVAAPEKLVPRVNVFCEGKLPWVDSVSSLKSFDAAPIRSA